MNNNAFSETEDTSLKQFLTGSRVYIMLAAAVISLIVFAPTFAAILGIYGNVNQAKNITELTELDITADLHDQYVHGSAYKFLAKLGYIAETEAAANDYYYLMYLDVDGEQIATLVQADKRGDADIAAIIDAYLAYAQDPDAGYKGKIIEFDGRFKKMSGSEAKMLDTGMSKLGIKGAKLDGYTLKVAPLPEANDTVPYWFIAVPFGIATVVCAVLFVYGLILEDKREKANLSPYPYLNRKKKK